MERKVTAGFLIGATVAANAAFFGLGSSFDYPDILQRPTAEILQLFVATRPSTMAWFALLALGAALLAPAAVLLARQFEGSAARWSARLGGGGRDRPGNWSIPLVPSRAGLCFESIGHRRLCSPTGRGDFGV
jgi:hypothetical protein